MVDDDAKDYTGPEDGARARHGDPETSHKAARSLSRKTVALMGKRLMWAISQNGDQGMTWFEVERFFKDKSDEKLVKQLIDCLVGFFRQKKDERIFRQSVSNAVKVFMKRLEEEEMLRQSISPRRVELERAGMLEFRYDVNGMMIERLNPKSNRMQGVWFLTPLGREMLAAWLAVWKMKKVK